MTPKAAVHRRGGTHRVKDADLTYTKFDGYDYKQLKNECIERGIWIKDMKKVAMAQALAKNESEKKQAENAARHEKANREHWATVEKKREDDRKLKEGAEKRKRQMEREKRREIDGNVSEDTMDEGELAQMHEQMLQASGNQQGSDAGEELLSSEESWRSESTDTTFHSTEPTIVPQGRLRLFEWTYIAVPSGSLGACSFPIN
jgi:flagellar biosynthesis GTPase FlhF